MERQLALLFKAIGTEEIQVEDARQTLAEEPKFEPYTAFKSIDQDSRDFITASQLQSFLRVANLDTYIQDLEVISKINSAQGDGKIVYYDFLNMILPKVNPELRRVCVQREPYYTQKDFSLPFPVRFGIANVFERIITGFRKLELLKHEISAGHNVEPLAIYDAVTGSKTANTLDFEALKAFFEKNQVEIDEEQIFAFLKCTDKDKDGKLGYVEFTEAITPMTPISPINHVEVSPVSQFNTTSRVEETTQKPAVVAPVVTPESEATVNNQTVEEQPVPSRRESEARVVQSHRESLARAVPSQRESAVRATPSQRESVGSRKVLTRFSTPQRRSSPTLEYRNELSCANIFFESHEKLRKYDRLAHTVRRTIASNLRSRSPSPRKSANPSRRSRPGTPSRASTAREAILSASRENSPLRAMNSREGSPLRVSRQASPLRVSASRQESPLRVASSHQSSPLRASSLRQESPLKASMSRRESEASLPNPPKMQNIVSNVKTTVSCEASPMLVSSVPIDTSIVVQKEERSRPLPTIQVQTRETFKPVATPERRERYETRETFRQTPEKTERPSVNPLREAVTGAVTERTSVRSGIVVKNKSLYRSGAGSKTDRSENYITVSPTKRKSGHEVAVILKRQIDLAREIEEEKNRLALKGDFNLLEAFRLFDADESEYITRSQLQSGLEALEVFVAKEELSLLIKKLDKDADGLIQFSDLRDLLTPKEEFCAQNLINKVPSYKVPEDPTNTFRPDTMGAFKRAIKIIISNEIELDRLRRQLNPQHLYSGVDAFSVLDKNQDGYITIDELSELLEDCLVAVGRPELLNLFNKYDKDRDGRISYSDFIQETLSKAY